MRSGPVVFCAAHAETVQVGGLVLAVRRSARARRIRLVAEPEHGIVVVAPVGAPRRAIEAAARAHAAWAEAQTARIASRRRSRIGYDRPGLAWIDGVPVALHGAAGPRARARLAADGVHVVAPDAAAATAAVERLYRRIAAERVAELLPLEARRLGLAPSAVRVRDTRSRWGSCSSRGAISLSWRLVLAPPDVLRYVAVHELCHLDALHHRPAFWRAVDAALPGWRTQAAWLKEHGWELLAHRPLPGGISDA